MRGSSGQVRPPASLGGNKAPCPPSCLGRWQQAGGRRRRQGGKPCRGGSWGPVSKARRLPAAYHRVPPPSCVHSDLWLLIAPPLLANCAPYLTIEKTPTICHFDFKNSPTLLKQQALTMTGHHEVDESFRMLMSRKSHCAHCHILERFEGRLRWIVAK